MIKERLKRLGVFGLALSLMIQPLTTLADTNKNIKQFINNVDTKVELTEVETGAETEDEDTLDIVSSTEECDESENIEISTETYEVETEETTVETEETTVETEETTEILDDSIINIVNDTSSSDVYVIDGVSYDINNAVSLSNEYATSYLFENESTLLVTHYQINSGLSFSSSSVYPYYGYDFSNVIFTDDILEITPYAFQNNTNIKNIRFSQKMRWIWGYAFQGCTNLETGLTFPDSLLQIEKYAFQGCKSIKGDIKLNIPMLSNGTLRFDDDGDGNYITYLWDGLLGNYCFADCQVDGNLIINGTTCLGSSAFENSIFTGNCNVLNDNSTINWTYYVPKKCFYNCSFGGTINLSNRVYTIYDDAFSYCTAQSITFELNDTNGLEIKQRAFQYSNIKGQLVLPENTKSINVSAFEGSAFEGELYLPSLSEFGNYMFKDCVNLTKVSFAPNTIISKGMFQGCTGLKQQLELPSNCRWIYEYAFMDCTGLYGDLIIPDTVDSLGASAFNGCTGLNGTIKLSNNLTELEAAIFKNCENVKSLECIPDGITIIQGSTFSNCRSLYTDIVIPSSVVSIGSYTFENCSSLKSIAFNEGLEKIYNNAFYGCSGLTGSLNLPSTLTFIGEYAFYKCSSLTGDLILPESITDTYSRWGWEPGVGDYAFAECSGLDGKLTLYSSCNSISDYVFYNCSNISELDWNGSNPDIIGWSAFENCSNMDTIIDLSDTLIDYCAFMNCASIDGDIFLEDGDIRDSAFEGCTKLDGCVNIGGTRSTGSYIGDRAFYGCVNLDTVNLENINGIGDYAFYECSNLHGDLVIGTAKYMKVVIGSHAFENCSKLSGTLIIPENVIQIGEYAFNGCTGFTGELKFDMVCNYVSYYNTPLVGEKAFYNMTGITSITGNGLTENGGDSTYGTGPLDIDPEVFGLDIKPVKTIQSGLYDDETDWRDVFWEINRYPITVKFISDGNTISEYDIFYSDNNKITLPENPTKEGYAFVKWNYKVDNELTELTSDTYVTRDLALSSSGDSYILEIEAEYATTYDITFDTGTDKQIEKQTIKENKKAIKPTEELTKEGYTFDCWLLNGKEYDFDTPVTSDITLVAKWNINNYIIKFDSNGGNQIENQTVEYNSNVKEPDNPVRENYNFIGWFIDDVKYDFSTPVKSDITLVAKWNIKTYSVYFDSTGGSSIAKQEVIHNGNAKEPENPTKDNCKFLGWYSDKDCENKYDFNSPVTSDITLYAKWLDTFTITFDSNGGKCDIPSKIVAITEPYGELPIPTKEQHEFSGWFTEKDNGVQVVSDTIKETDKDEILYAHWNEYQYTIKFDANGGKGEMTDITLKYSEENKLSKNKFTRKGYKFIGWSTDKNAKTAEYKNQESVSKLTSENNKEVTLYAVWKKQTTPTTVNDTPEEPTPTPSSSNEQQTSSTSPNTTQVSAVPQVIENVKTSDNQNIMKFILVLIVGALAIVIGITTKTNKK